MKAKLRTVFLILLIISVKAQLFATAQFPDRLILNNEEKPLCANPLNAFFKKTENSEKYNALLSKYDVVTCTACWRGYIATFEIIDSALYVADLTIKIVVEPTDKQKSFQTKDISIFQELFGSDKPFLCDFYSGMLIVPQGKMVKYVHGGYLSEYEKYILIKITDGKVINKGEYSLQEYKDKKDKAFELFYKSNKYNDCWNGMKSCFVESISEESKKAIMKDAEDVYLYDFFEF
mgnify:CR=1 FL=1